MKPEIQVNKKCWFVKVRNYKLVVMRENGYFRLIHINIPGKFEMSPEFSRALHDWKNIMPVLMPTSIDVPKKETTGVNINVIMGKYFHPFFLHYYISWIYFNK